MTEKDIDKSWKNISQFLGGMESEIKTIVAKIEADYQHKIRKLEDEYNERIKNLTPIKINGEDAIKTNFKIDYSEKGDKYSIRMTPEDIIEFCYNGQKDLNSLFIQIGEESIAKNIASFYKKKCNQDKTLVLSFVPINKLEKEVQE